MIRFARLLLSLTVVVASLAAAPCGAGAACPIMRKMDCCRMKTGIASPRCCERGPQLSRAGAPATAERPSTRAVVAPAFHVGVVVAIASPIAPQVIRDRDAGRAPPGGPLLAHATSLLL
jgi:hypothetical protein